MSAASPSIVMMGATGAVGSEVVRALAQIDVGRLSLLGRRVQDELTHPAIHQHVVDVVDPSSYEALLTGHSHAICTLGVGQPSKTSKEDFLRIDRDAVLAFAQRCREAGVAHFQLLGSIGASSASRSFYLRSKGQLEDALREMEFDRLSLFQPSMIMTPTNRYGITQAIALKVWPLLDGVLVGGLKKYRGVRVETLGRAIACNVATLGAGVETLRWDAFDRLASFC